MNFTDNDIEELLEGIYSGRITEYNLSKKLYKAIGNYMQKGLYKGFGATIETVFTGDAELLLALRENTWMFSAAKTYQQTKDIRSLLFDEDGKLVDRREFNRLGRAAYDNWNQNYGNTEYNTCVLGAQNAVKWQEIEANKHLFPHVRYSAIGDACAICRPLDGLVFRVGDAALSKISPLNHFNCMCILIQEEKEVETTKGRNKIVNEVEQLMKPTFINNIGQTGMVFPPGHPYFAEANKELGKRNFGLKIPKT